MTQPTKPAVPDLVSAEQPRVIIDRMGETEWSADIHIGDLIFTGHERSSREEAEKDYQVARAALSRGPHPCENCADLQARNDHLIQMYADLSNSIRPNDLPPLPQPERKENK